MAEVDTNNTVKVVFFFIIFLVFVIGFFSVYLLKKKNRKRKSYRPSQIVIEKFKKKYPGISDGEVELVWQALYSFFELIRKKRKNDSKFEAYMTSVIVDDLWHEMILDTRNYINFCKSFYGGYIHHRPGTVTFETDFTNKEVNLETVKTYCALREMNAELYNGLPLLLSVDEALGLKNGFKYNVDLLNKQLVEFEGIYPI